MIEVIILIWVICGIVNYGAMFAFFQNEFKSIAEENRSHDIGFILIVSMSGPIALITTALTFGFKHGFKWAWR